eukprot:scaffold74274_cov51-Phaeocystis_antarctica.AAC.2
MGRRRHRRRHPRHQHHHRLLRLNPSPDPTQVRGGDQDDGARRRAEVAVQGPAHPRAALRRDGPLSSGRLVRGRRPRCHARHGEQRRRRPARRRRRGLALRGQRLQRRRRRRQEGKEGGGVRRSSRAVSCRVVSCRVVSRVHTVRCGVLCRCVVLCAHVPYRVDLSMCY